MHYAVIFPGMESKYDDAAAGFQAIRQIGKQHFQRRELPVDIYAERLIYPPFCFYDVAIATFQFGQGTFYYSRKIRGRFHFFAILENSVSDHACVRLVGIVP